MKRTIARSRRRLPSPAIRRSPSASDEHSIAVANRQRRRPIDIHRLRSAVAAVLRGEGIAKADVSIAVVSDSAIHKINRQFLNHDEPTDVISFVLDQSDELLDGEIVVSADTAATAAKRFGWSASNELLLYVIHGALHLVGYDDLKPAAKRQMRARERYYLSQFGVKPATGHSSAGNSKTGESKVGKASTARSK